MGLLDFITNKLEEVTESSASARDEAENLSEWEIVRRLKYISGFAKISGYIAVLREKCDGLGDNELIELLESSSKDHNAKAVQAIAPVMEERNLIFRDGDGKIYRKYSY